MTQTLYALYADQAAAAQAVERQIALGISRDAIRTIGAERDHVGSFADSGMHNHGAERDHAGSFADSGMHNHSVERDHVGSFADSGMHNHDAERDRVGSFATVDRGMPRPTPLIGELLAAGLAPAEAEEAARQIAAGSTLVIVMAPQEHAPAVMSAFGHQM